jgi:molybdenum cofactor synthesis domain-containing protein
MHSDFVNVRQRGFSERKPVKEALRIFFEKSNLKLLGIEELEFDKSLNRVCAEDVLSKRDVPHFNRSAVDGYAVRAVETHGASVNNPLLFRLKGSVEIGENSELNVSEGEAVKVSTGSPLPKGADAVVMLEYTNRIDAELIEIYSPVTPWQNVSRAGEDVKHGEVVIKKGEVIQPQHIGLLTATGNLKIKVYRKPVVAVISTGDELIEPDQEPEAGKIVDANRFMLINSLLQLNAQPVDFGIVRDDYDSLKNALEKALKYDMVIFSGGTSVGTKDLLPEIMNAYCNPGILVHGLAIKPGMPAGLCSCDGKPVVLLPGFPVAAFVAFNLLIPPIIYRMMDMEVNLSRFLPAGSVIRATAGRRITSSAGIRSFTRVFLQKEGGLEGGFVAYPIRTSGSGIISSLVRADGIVEVQEGKEGYEKGEEVYVRLIRPYMVGDDEL